jgi:alkylated DNA nucleotide flippase Atl1
MERKVIESLYNHFKDTEKKLKIVCDWDEVIQSLEPFALYQSLEEKKNHSAKLKGLLNAAKVYNLCSQVPKGRVSTYKLISSPVYGSVRFARQVGNFLKNCSCSFSTEMTEPDDYQCPRGCYRVIRNSLHVGEFIDDAGKSRMEMKIGKLKKEEVEFDEKGYLVRKELIFRRFSGGGRKDWKFFFEVFWEKNLVDYSPYGSRLLVDFPEQAERKNHPQFYQSAPFLSLARELLMLVKENKADVVFLSAFDKGVFSDGDPRKKKIFAETFGNFPNCSLKLIGFKWGENQKTKGEWVKENMPDCDILLDDNPNILADALTQNPNLIAVAPYYPIVKHNDKVILIKNNLSNLSIEDFKKSNFAISN